MKKILLLIRATTRNICRDTGANTMLVFAMSAAALVGAAGGAIDMGRAQMLQAKLSSALDAAGLAAGASASTTTIPTEARSYFDANFNAATINATVDSFSAVPNADNTIITLSARATSPTTFMRYFGKTSITVSANSEITRTSKGMELVLVLDITGSMAGSKITSLRNAANDLVNVLYGSNTTLQNFWIGLVPYVASVNIGNNNSAWVANYATSIASYPGGTWPAARRYGPANPTLPWKGCVEERTATGGLDTNDTPPNVADPNTLFPIYYWPDTPTTSTTLGNTDNNWFTDAGALNLNEAYGYQNNGSSGGRGPNVACGQPIQPFTSSKATIQTAINGLQEWRRGGTASSTGLAWGWRFLSPNWRGLWNHELVSGQVKLPLNYRTDLMDKVIVLMTDGINEFYDAPVRNASGNDQDMDPFHSDYTAYKRLNDLRPDFNTTNQATAVGIVNTKTTTMCTALKAQGVIIYTVTFQLGNSTAENNARTLFRNCASKPDYYFDAESTVPGATQVNLSTAFRTIGDSLANLRISK